MEATEAATRFRNAVASLRENMEALVQAQGDERRLSDLLAEFPLLLLDLKASSRATHLGVDHYRQLVRDYKKTLDAHHLQLQNLLYRKHHLLREMMLCHDFKIPEVHLVEKNEHISIVGDGSDLASVEQHQARLKLLTDEMQARKRLEQTLQVCSGDLSVISLKLRAESNLRPPPNSTLFCFWIKFVWALHREVLEKRSGRCAAVGRVVQDIPSGPARATSPRASIQQATRGALCNPGKRDA